MAVYIRQTQGVYAVDRDPAFIGGPPDGYHPGSRPQHSGIYRCRKCSVEVVAEQGKKFPPSHSSEVAGHEVRWDLIVRTGVPGTKAQNIFADIGIPRT